MKTLFLLAVLQAGANRQVDVVLGAKLRDLSDVRYERVGADSRGRIYALNRALGRLDAIGPGGDLLRSIGAGGAELGVATAVAVDERDRVYVLDARSRHVLRVGDATPRVDVLATFDHPVSDICVMRGRVYAFGLHEGYILYARDLASGAERSFGEPLGDLATTRGQAAVASGRLVCLSHLNRLLVVPTALPEIRLYDADGRVVWVDTLQQYIGSIVAEDGAGRLSFSASSAGYHQLVGATQLSADVVAIQLAFHDRLGKLLWTETRLISLDRGAAVGTQRDLPQILCAQAPILVVAEGDPQRLTTHQFQLRHH